MIIYLDGRLFHSRIPKCIRPLAITVFVIYIVPAWTICLLWADNYPEAYKRPLSSTAPTIIDHPDGSFFLSLGAAGGSKIFPAIFQVILNLDWGLDISSAIEYGRLHHQLYPEWLNADAVYPREILADLERRGHSLHSA
jgi:gamma-glutamyltranspeptidase